MSELSATRVRDVVVAHLADKIEELSLNPGEMGDDFDLLGEGLVDSFGLLELIGSLEATLGVSLDFEDLDVGSLTVLGPFCLHVSTQVNGVTAVSRDVRPVAEVVRGAADSAAQWKPRLSPATPVQAKSLRRSVGRGFLGAYRTLVRVRDKTFSVGVGGRFLAFGPHTVLQMPVRLSGEDRIAIGAGVFIGGGSWLQVLDECEDRVGIEIGDGTAFAGLCVISSAKSIRIGRSVSFARNVYVADHAHAYDRSTRPVMEQGITDIRPVEIGDGAWLGQNVVVLPGTRIGHGAVIGANSVVHSDIPSYALALGSPARVIRRFAAPADE